MEKKEKEEKMRLDQREREASFTLKERGFYTVNHIESAEMALRREELELNKARFELERKEREAGKRILSHYRYAIESVTRRLCYRLHNERFTKLNGLSRRAKVYMLYRKLVLLFEGGNYSIIIINGSEEGGVK